MASIGNFPSEKWIKLSSQGDDLGEEGLGEENFEGITVLKGNPEEMGGEPVEVPETYVLEVGKGEGEITITPINEEEEYPPI